VPIYKEKLAPTSIYFEEPELRLLNLAYRQNFYTYIAKNQDGLVL